MVVSEEFHRLNLSEKDEDLWRWFTWLLLVPVIYMMSPASLDGRAPVQSQPCWNAFLWKVESISKQEYLVKIKMEMDLFRIFQDIIYKFKLYTYLWLNIAYLMQPKPTVSSVQTFVCLMNIILRSAYVLHKEVSLKGPCEW